MKVVVINLPTNPKECLFACKKSKQGRVNGKVQLCWDEYICNIDNKLCDFNKGHGCNKLKDVFLCSNCW